MTLAPLSPPQPPRPKFSSSTLTASKRLSVIEYLHTKPQPPPDWHRDEHPTYDPTYPTTYILSLLPKSSLKTVRLVSRDWYDWASKASPPLFENLHIEISPTTLSTIRLRTLEVPAQECRHLIVTFPATALNTRSPPPENAILPDFPNLINLTIEYPNNGLTEPQRLALQNPAKHCRHLTITFPTHSTSTPAPHHPPPKLPELPDLQNLHLICPPTNIFDRLLSLRSTLQAADRPHLHHLSISALTITGIAALRCGTFTSLGSSSWTDRKIWYHLQSLDIELIPWCENMHTSPYRGRSREEKREWCTGLKMLHDWLHNFAILGQLQLLKFSWRGTEGPNPLLVEDVAKGVSGGRWFSAPSVRWGFLRELWLGNVRVSAKEVEELKERMRGLQVLMVEEGLVDDKVMGWSRLVDGIRWFEIQLVDGVAELEGDLPLFLSHSHSYSQDRVTEELANDFESGAPDPEETGSGEATAEALMEEITIKLDTMPVRGSRHGIIFSRGSTA